MSDENPTRDDEFGDVDDDDAVDASDTEPTTPPDNDEPED